MSTRLKFLRSSKRLFAALAVMLMACHGTAALAQASDAERIDALERRLAQSLRLIEQLNRRVVELERAGTSATESAAAPAAAASAAPRAVAQGSSAPSDPERAIGELRQTVSQITETLSRGSGTDTGLPVHGFLDIGGGWSSSGDPSRLRGFNAGTMDLYLTPQINDRISALVEMVFEFNEDGAEVDLERLQIGYTFNDSLTLWGGRFHSPFGYWNTAFHHGSNLQTSISRPLFLEFEDRGGLLPVHSVGLWAHGKTRLGDARLDLDGYVANGPSIIGGRLHPNTSNDDNAGKLWGLHLGYKPGGNVGDLGVGLHAYGTRVNAYEADGSLRSSTRTRALGGYLAWDTNSWDLMAEYYGVHNTSGGTKRRSQLGYVQLGRTFGAYTPYVRLERAVIASDDPYFASLRSGRTYGMATAGLRYALDSNASLKFELQDRRIDGATLIDTTGAPVRLDPAAFRRALVQFSIAF